MEMWVKVIQLGIGPIGQQITRYLSEREGIAVVGAVDPDPDKAGRDLGELCGIQKIGVPVCANLSSVSAKREADLAIISTQSSLQKVELQIKAAADHNLNIVSTCEELSHPWQTQPECAAQIDQYCKGKGVACLGTGVNPGFLMDYLPSVLTSVCQNVKHIKVERVQNAEPRRRPFRDKIGVGLSKAEFEQKKASIRHVGLKESVHMIADAMNWQLDPVEETLTPVIAERDLQNGEELVQKGQIAGVQQIARGSRDGKEVITLHFKAAIGIEDYHDTIHIFGEPEFKSTIPGGINGDIGTSAIIVNAVRSVTCLSPGLKTMLDLPVPAYFEKY